MPDLTEDDIKNGWTEESLAEYHRERERAQAALVGFDPKHRTRPRPKWANSQYSVLRWRG